MAWTLTQQREDDALAELCLSIPKPLLDAYRVQIRAELLSEVEEGHLNDLERMVQDMRESERQRYDDRLFAYQDDIEEDLAARVQERLTKAKQVYQEQIQEQLEDLKTELAAALARAEEAETALQGLILALFPKVNVRRALARHCTIATLSLVDLAAPLARLGWRLTCAVGGSSKTLTVETTEGPRHFTSITRRPLLPDDDDAAPEDEPEANGS